jgi:hypothetical protein
MSMPNMIGNQQAQTITIPGGGGGNVTQNVAFMVINTWIN